MSIQTKLARDTIELYLTKKELPNKEKYPELLAQRAACFVSLHKKDGGLRGCIGSVRPMYKSLAGEIIANSIAAATQDDRFEPVTFDELRDLKVSVDVLSEPEIVDSPKDLDVKKYGIIVQTADGRSGLLLPNIDGINSADDQLIFAREKGGIEPDEPVSIFRFLTSRFEDVS